MSRLLVVNSLASRPWLLRQMLRRRHRVDLLTLPGQPVTPGIGRIEIPDFRRNTLLATLGESAPSGGRAVASSSGSVQLDRPDAVICWNQFSAPAATLLADHWSLPKSWDPAFGNLAEKIDVHRLWQAAGLAVPPLTVIASDDDEVPELPVVVKPSALGGGVGVVLCRTAEEYRAHVTSMRAALAGTGPGRWMRQVLDRHALSHTLLRQPYLPAEPVCGTDYREFSAEFVVRAGQPTLLGMFAKAHVGAPYFAETVLMTPPPGDVADVLAALAPRLDPLLRATGLQWAVAHLEFCVVDGEVVPFELNPRLIGDPAAVQLADAYAIDLDQLLVATALGQGGRRVSAASASGGGYYAMVDLRAPLAASGRRLAGLDLADPPGDPAPTVHVEADLTAGDPIDVSPLRGPKRVATVVLTCASEADRERVVDWAAHPDRVRLGAAPVARQGRLRAQLLDDLPDPAGWDGLASGADVFSSRAWLAAVERMPGGGPTRYAAVLDDAGLVAVTPLWVADQGLSSSHRPPGYPTRADVPRRPLLLAGSRAGYTATWLVDPALAEPDRVAATRLLLDLVAEQAQRSRCEQAWLPYAGPDTSRLLGLAGLATPGPAAPPTAEVNLAGLSYPQWCEAQPAHRRSILSRERRLFDRSPLTVRRVRLAGQVPFAAGLLARQQAKFGGGLTKAAAANYLDALAVEFGAAAVLILLCDADRARGFCLVLEAGGALDARVYGGDPLPAAAQAYFRLGLHEPVRLALARGLGQLTLGPGSYGVKVRHGARLVGRRTVPLYGPPTEAIGGADRQSGSRRAADRTDQPTRTDEHMQATARYEQATADELAADGLPNAFAELYGPGAPAARQS